jgi:hypothetical protein
MYYICTHVCMHACRDQWVINAPESGEGRLQGLRKRHICLTSPRLLSWRERPFVICKYMVWPHYQKKTLLINLSLSVFQPAIDGADLSFCQLEKYEIQVHYSVPLTSTEATLVSHIFYFGATRAWTWGLTVARQALYHLSPLSTFLVGCLPLLVKFYELFIHVKYIYNTEKC